MRFGTLLVLAAVTILVALTIGLTLGTRRPPTELFVFFPEDSEIVVVFPHRQREAFARYLVQELATYLAATHPRAAFHVVAAQDTSDRIFSRSVCLNVALAHVAATYPPGQAVVVQDVDVVPRRNVSYECPPRGTVHIWWLNAGGMKGRLGDFQLAGGFSNLFSGWGGEETSFWNRLKAKMIDHPVWYKLDKPRGAVVLDLQGHDQAYWHSGENANGDDDDVFFASQSHAEYGVGGAAVVNAEGPNWYDAEWFKLNEALKEYMDGLSPADLDELAQADGMRAVDLARVRGDDFFAGLRISPNLRATNLVFDQGDVLTDLSPSLYGKHEPVRTYLDRIRTHSQT